MNRLLGSHHAAGHLDSAIGDDFIGVHVGLRAGAGLPDDKREMIIQLAGDDLIGGLDDQIGLLRRQQPQLLVDQRSGFLQNTEGADQLMRHPLAADLEIIQRPGRLAAIVAICRNLHFPHAVGLYAVLHKILLIVAKNRRIDSQITRMPQFVNRKLRCFSCSPQAEEDALESVSAPNAQSNANRKPPSPDGIVAKAHSQFGIRLVDFFDLAGLQDSACRSKLSVPDRQRAPAPYAGSG